MKVLYYIKSFDIIYECTYVATCMYNIYAAIPTYSS